MTSTSFRLPAGGRIDRRRQLEFQLDGRILHGFQGDTLASALLANDVRLVGRSFKYHRPRGFISSGVDEPNGLFTLGEKGRSEPNIPGTTTPLRQGLRARRQNGWPSVDFDLLRINSLFAPFLSAGFYYKTFMGPRRGSWMFYEPFIRRAAGLGRGTYERDPDRYETRQAFTDVLVIGSGPAGLSAALAAARAGARVVLAEQDMTLGGSLLGERPSGPTESWLRQMETELESLPAVEMLRSTTVFGLYDGNTAALIERRDHLAPDPSRGEPRQITITLRAHAIVFATGATERPLVFPNNDRPGVMLTSAVRCYLNRFAVACGRSAVLVTGNDSAYTTACDLVSHGVPATIADLRLDVSNAMLDKARERGIEVIRGATVLDVIGSSKVRAIELSVHGSAASSNGSSGHACRRRIDCDLICMSGGWSPSVHLTSHGGIRPGYMPDLGAFVPGGYAPGQFGAGAVIGSVDLEGAAREGREAGLRAAAYAGRSEVAAMIPVPSGVDVAEHSADAVCKMHHHSAGHFSSKSKAFVDFQNDVTMKDLEIAHQEGYQSVEHLKRYTTLGMGTDQGKTSHVNAIALMAGLRNIPPAAAGTTTFRPPFTPVAIGALAGRNVGLHFRPIRRSPLHDWHIRNDAEMIEAGPWLRPWWYRWAGTSAQSAYIEEMRLVRRGAGLSDVSTLGKIDLQGPDAGEFLNRVYVNGFAKLPIGKARYGVMLNDDGTVLDDGTTTRLSESRYFMTTTTAQAAEVMSWLEFLLQTAWPDLKVHVTSVTDEWAGMAVAGPKARAVLELALAGRDFSNARLPHMGCMELEEDGVPLRIIRLSFSGELAYEVYSPADYGIALWQHFLERAKPLGLRPFGLEALASLRIEKGHVAGLELDHRNTLDDLGLGKMASKDKAFVGRELRQRPYLQTPERWSLVGIECLESGKTLRGGSILFALTDAIKGHGRGYITSVTWSTELEKFIALGLYQGGLGHAGEEIVAAYPLKGEQVRVRIVSPVFLDPAGERLRV